MSIWGRINRGKICLACIAMLAALLFSTVVFALEPVVKEVDITGNRRTPAETIKEILTMRREGRLNMDLVDADIKRIYKLGQFQDVHAETSPAEERRQTHLCGC